MLLTWWEHANAAEPQDAQAYHSKTRLPSGRIGLLVDPGAHDNLVGGLTSDAMCDQLGVEARSRTLNRSLSVEGVGKNAQTATESRTLLFDLHDSAVYLAYARCVSTKPC